MFSQELINRIKAYFQERHGVVFSDDQAVDALNSLADLYLFFTKDEGDQGFPPLCGKPAPLLPFSPLPSLSSAVSLNCFSVSLDLISPHSCKR